MIQVRERGLAAEIRDVRERAVHPGAAVGFRDQPRRRRRRVESFDVRERGGDIQAAVQLASRLPEPVAPPVGLAGAVHRRRQRHRRR